MKYLLFFHLLSIFSLSTQAASDSVGVFHRNEKVVVLVNEERHKRLDEIFKLLQAPSRILWLAADKSFKMSCGQTSFRTACTLSFYNSANIDIGDRDVRAIVNLSDYDVQASEDFEFQFESSRKDIVIFKSVSNILHIYATKRESYP